VALAYRISIHREDIFIERGVYPDDISHLMIYLEFQWRHGCVKVDPVQIMQQKNLTITLATIARFGTLSGLANLHDNHISEGAMDNKLAVDAINWKMHLRNNVTLKLIEPRINLAIIQSLRPFAYRLE